MISLLFNEDNVNIIKFFDCENSALISSWSLDNIFFLLALIKSILFMIKINIFDFSDIKLKIDC